MSFDTYNVDSLKTCSTHQKILLMVLYRRFLRWIKGRGKNWQLVFFDKPFLNTPETHGGLSLRY